MTQQGVQSKLKSQLWLGSPQGSPAKQLSVFSEENASPALREGLALLQEASRSVHTETRETRKRALLRVFELFDCDGSGFVESSELPQLGKMRRELGQRTSVWTAERNEQLIRAIDQNHDHKLSAQEFWTHFERELPHDPHSFSLVVQQFTQVAQALGERGCTSGRYVQKGECAD